MNYFLKGLMRLPLIILRIVGLPIIVVVFLILCLIEKIEQIGGKPHRDFIKTRQELFLERLGL